MPDQHPANHIFWPIGIDNRFPGVNMNTMKNVGKVT
jgi:hypothetical protein